MMRKILAAIDGSDHAWKALDLAADIAKQHGAQLIVPHVVPFEPMAEALRAFARLRQVGIAVIGHVCHSAKRGNADPSRRKGARCPV